MTYRISTTQSELNLLPGFCFTVGSVIVLGLCQLHPFSLNYLLPGIVVALTCLAGIVAGLVGRHWLVGMAISLAISTIAANLYYVCTSIQSPIGSIRNIVAFQLVQLIPTVVLVSSAPALLMRFLRSWRLVADRSPRGAPTIEDLLVLMTFVALMIAAAMNASSNDDFLSSVVSVGGIGYLTVAIFLPLVRNSLSDSRIAKKFSSSELGYFLIAGVPIILLASISEGWAALVFGVPYCAFAVCLKAGIHCLDLTGLEFRSQQMDREAQDYAIADSAVSSKESSHALGPLSNESFDEGPLSGRTESTKSHRDISIVHGRWALGSIAFVVIALSILRMLFGER